MSVRVKATAKYLRGSTRRAQLVVRAIKGKQVADAASILRFLPHASARDVAAVLTSATANAEANHGIPADRLWVVDASADEGFPVPEATSLTLLTNVYNFVTLVFLFIPAEGNAFVWCIVAGIIVNIAALHIFYKPGLARRQVDDGLIDPDTYAAAAAAADGKKLPTDGAAAALLGGGGGAGFDGVGIQ